MVNLKKLAVGAKSLNNLKDFQNKKIMMNENFYHITRQKPTRYQEILLGGSLYWIISNRFSARQVIIGFEDIFQSDGKRACKIILKNELIEVENRKHRPFQGWRYLKDEDVPNDIKIGSNTRLPVDLNEHLLEFGFLKFN